MEAYDSPPVDRVPGLVPVRQYVVTAERAAVMLLEVRAYSQGCVLEFVATARPVAEKPPVFTVECGDRTERVVRALDAEPGAARLWISPLPPVEGFVLVTDWDGHGVAGVRAHLPGDTIRQAAWDSFPCLPRC